MRYPFECECGHHRIIEMSITMHRSDGHYCSLCGKEMTREVESLVCGMSVDKTDTFYRRVN